MFRLNLLLRRHQHLATSPKPSKHTLQVPAINRITPAMKPLPIKSRNLPIISSTSTTTISHPRLRNPPTTTLAPLKDRLKRPVALSRILKMASMFGLDGRPDTDEKENIPVAEDKGVGHKARNRKRWRAEKEDDFPIVCYGGGIF